MNFASAYQFLIQNRKIRRKAWENSIYIEMTDKAYEFKVYRQEAVPFQYDISILNHTNIDNMWCIVGEDNVRYLFADAIAFLLEGKNIRLNDWPADCYLEATKDGKELFMRRKCEYEFTPTFQCFTSDDWAVIKD